MEPQSKEEKKNQRIGMAVSLGVHALLLLIFAFLLAWKEPNPPIPEYGIEVNFGLDNQGSGRVQPESVTRQDQNTSETEDSEQTTPEDEAEADQTEPVDDTAEPESAEQTSEASNETPVTENVASPDVRKEEPTKVPANKPVKEEAPKEVKKETRPEPVAEKKPAATETTKVTEEKPAATSGGVPSDKVVESKSQGDNTAATGDKGNPEGTVDARALYGTPGGGASLDMAGWAWEEVPKPQDTSNESGRLVFEITVDDSGEVIGIKTLERGVSAAVEAIYKKEVAGLYFRRNPPNSPAPPRSTGKITFIIKSR